MLKLDIWTIAFQVINFVALAALLHFLLFRPLMRRAKEHAVEKERLADASARDRQEAEGARLDLEARLANAEEEAVAIVTGAREQAEAERVALLREAEAEAERILAEAHATSQRLRDQAAEDFHDELVDTILGVSAAMIGRAAPSEVHDALVQQLSDRIWEMGRGEMEQVETLRRSLGEREPTAHVTTARPLSPEQQGLLASTFSALADRSVNLDVTTDPALAAGIRVRLGDVEVDSSIADQLGELREDVAQFLRERAAGE